jgi:hypothetical protein
MTGLLTSTGELKAWGREFQKLSTKYAGHRIPPKKMGPRPAMDWAACLSSMKAMGEYRAAYLKAFLDDQLARVD